MRILGGVFAVTILGGVDEAWNVKHAAEAAFKTKEARRVTRVEEGAPSGLRFDTLKTPISSARKFRSLFKNVDEQPFNAELWDEAQAAAARGGLNFLGKVLESVRAGGDIVLGDKRGGYQTMLSDVNLVASVDTAQPVSEQAKSQTEMIMLMSKEERSVFLQLGAEEQAENLRRLKKGGKDRFWEKLVAWQSNMSAHIAQYRNGSRPAIATVAPEWTFPLDFDWLKADGEQLARRPAWDQLQPPPALQEQEQATSIEQIVANYPQGMAEVRGQGKTHLVYLFARPYTDWRHPEFVFGGGYYL
jgi:hypothetical protein